MRLRQSSQRTWGLLQVLQSSSLQDGLHLHLNTVCLTVCLSAFVCCSLFPQVCGGRRRRHHERLELVKYLLLQLLQQQNRSWNVVLTQTAWARAADGCPCAPRIAFKFAEKKVRKRLEEDEMKTVITWGGGEQVSELVNLQGRSQSAGDDVLNYANAHAECAVCVSSGLWNNKTPTSPLISSQQHKSEHTTSERKPVSDSRQWAWRKQTGSRIPAQTTLHQSGRLGPTFGLEWETLLTGSKIWH